jgi:purine-binding chemotaxis protein CheW
MGKRQLIVFEIGGSRYGVPIEAVQEIVRVPAISAVPDAPACYEGLMNLRGKVLPVMDLRKRLGSAANRDHRTRVLIAESDGRRLGMIVDAACEVLKITDEQIEAAPDLFESAQATYVAGVTRSAGGLVIVVDLKTLISTSGVAAASTSAASATVQA